MIILYERLVGYYLKNKGWGLRGQTGKTINKKTGNIIGDRDNFCSVTGRGIFQALLKCDLYIIKVIVMDWLVTAVEAHIVE
jgi:hypothetical protein